MESIMSTKVVSIMLVLLIAVEARESFTSYPLSDFSESEFPQDFEVNTNLPFQSKLFSFETQSDNPQVSEETNSPLETQSPPSYITQDLPLGAETDSEIDSTRHNPSPPPTFVPDPADDRAKAIIDKKCKRKCDGNTKCNRKEFVLRDLCVARCGKRCYHHYMKEIYDCDDKCGEAMPKKFKSDFNKALVYMDHCFHKCVKKIL